jgi:hypothetical protein
MHSATLCGGGAMEIGSLCCRLGLHAFEVVETQSDTDGSNEAVDSIDDENNLFTLKCRRCDVSEIRRIVEADAMYRAMWH